MIADLCGFLRDRLNKAIPRDASGGSAEDLFVYVGTIKEDAASFTANAVSMLLVRLEEETTLRRPDPFAMAAADGTRKRIEPEIRMNVYILFVARFPENYHLSLTLLSRVIRYFQHHRVFTREDSPELSERIPQLVLELVTPSFSEQNQIWGALRVSYQPSALYRVRMVVFQDEDGEPAIPTTQVIQTVVPLPSR